MNKIKPKSEDLKTLEWDEFYSTDLSKKLKYFESEGRIFDCLFSQQFNRKLLDRLFNIATVIRTIAKEKNGLDWLQTLLSNNNELYSILSSRLPGLSFHSRALVIGTIPLCSKRANRDQSIQTIEM